MATITTVAEADALRVGTRATDCHGDTWVKLPGGTWALSVENGARGGSTSRLLQLWGPLTVAREDMPEQAQQDAVPNRQAAIDLMPQLRDVLGLSGELDLPKLHRVAFEATYDAPGWRVAAQLAWLPTDLDRWEACRAWAQGATPTVSGKPRAFRKVAATVVVGDVTVEVWAEVTAAFEPPEQVHVTGEAVNLLIGGAA